MTSHALRINKRPFSTLERASAANLIERWQEGVHFSLLDKSALAGGGFGGACWHCDQTGQFGAFVVRQSGDGVFANVGNEFGKARAVGVIATRVLEPFDRVADMAKAFAAPGKPFEIMAA